MPFNSKINNQTLKNKPEIKILSIAHLILLCNASITSFNIENIEQLKYNSKNIFDFDDKHIAFVIHSWS